MRQFTTDEGMGLDLSLSVTSLTLTPGREERGGGGARGGGAEADEPAGPADRQTHAAQEATLVVQHARSPKRTPPPGARAAGGLSRRSGRRGVGGRGSSTLLPPAAAGRVLDGFAVVEACGVELPELVQSVNLMGQGFTDCQVDDMPHFVELQVSADFRLGMVRRKGAWIVQSSPGCSVSSRHARQFSRRAAAASLLTALKGCLLDGRSDTQLIAVADSQLAT